MKKLLLIFVFCFVALTKMWGEDKSLYLVKTDGGTEEFVLKDKPVITFADGNLSVATDNISFMCALENVKEYHFGMTSAIDDVRTHSRIELQDDNTVVFYGDYSVSDVVVSNMAGMSVQPKIVKGGNSISVSLSALPKGVYIVKAKGLTIKMSKK